MGRREEHLALCLLDVVMGENSGASWSLINTTKFTLCKKTFRIYIVIQKIMFLLLKHKACFYKINSEIFKKEFYLIRSIIQYVSLSWNHMGNLFIISFRENVILHIKVCMSEYSLNNNQIHFVSSIRCLSKNINFAD